MVKLRLTRMGSINKPFYRVIAIDSRSRRDGKYLDNVGYYDPKHTPAIITINEEKALKWLKEGAQPSDTVRSLFSKKGIMKKWHEMKYTKKGSSQPIEASKPIKAEEPIIAEEPVIIAEPVEAAEPVETNELPEEE